VSYLFFQVKQTVADCSRADNGIISTYSQISIPCGRRNEFESFAAQPVTSYAIFLLLLFI
jgi:hypothetical protein